MTADRLAALLDDALRPYLELLRSPDDQNGKIIRGVAARLAAAGVTVGLDVDRLAVILSDAFPALMRSKWPFTVDELAAAIARAYAATTDPSASGEEE